VISSWVFYSSDIQGTWKQRYRERLGFWSTLIVQKSDFWYFCINCSITSQGSTKSCRYEN